MRDAIGNISIAEIILLFLLLFLFPLLVLMLIRIRQYERGHGSIPGGAARVERVVPPPPAIADETGGADGAADAVYPYRARAFLSPADRACLGAMREALGPEVEVFPKVPLWELVEPTDGSPVFLRRLHDKNFDFLVCDRRTGRPLTAVMYNPGRGRPAGRIDEVKAICRAAGVHVVFIDMAEKYDAAGLRDALGIPDLDM